MSCFNFLTKENLMSNKGFILSLLVVAVAIMFVPDFAYADLQSSLDGIKLKLTEVILPAFSVIGIGLAAVSFFTGNPQAKQHIFYAVIGAILGFGAQSIVDFIGQTVR
jgi:hypothetical protein